MEWRAAALERCREVDAHRRAAGSLRHRKRSPKPVTSAVSDHGLAEIIYQLDG
jgi:hypothetical protein